MEDQNPTNRDVEQGTIKMIVISHVVVENLI